MDNTDQIKKQFFSSLKRGTGEAYLILKNNPDIDFSQYIIKGSLENFAYDPQSEGSRAKYMYGLIKTVKQKNKIISTILENLNSGRREDWGHSQVCDLAVIFYKNGHPEALEALRNRVKRNYGVNDWFGAMQLMEIGGTEGVLTIAEVIGKTIWNNKDFYEDSFDVDNFQKNNSSISIYDELKKAAKHNKYIDIYLKTITKNKYNAPSSKKSKRIKLSYEYVKAEIDAGKRFIVGPSRYNDLSQEEIEKLAHVFLDEKDKLKQEFYLRIFASRKFPLDYKRIFEIAKGRNPHNTRLVEFAFEALKYFSSKELRRFAISKLKTSKNPYDYLYLLVGNYKKGDNKLLVEIASHSNNFDYIHHLAYGVIEIYENNHTKECKEPLEAIYNRMNCGIHRVDIIRLLKRNNVLSKKIKDELKYDSYVNLADLKR